MKHVALMLTLMLAGCREQPAPAGAPARPGPNDVARVQVITPSEAASLKLVPGSEGLRLYHTVSGTSRLLAFGSAKDEVVRAVSLVRQAQPQEQGEVDECVANYVRWPGGLTVWFTQDRLSGWSLLAASAGLATGSGIKPGSSRSELEAAHSVQVVESSLGVEFTAGGLAGILSSPRPDGRITSLWAGMTCLAR